ncbi:MAG: triple tyrosine motif-containing protein [Salinivirgaceae bacterium]|jgi:ligand-binding sensor domain-containing protein/DNA-binding CsgD family transcriptional regulator|nr:triple tyrosine motif-containing protein [Salinivirgaceae bacterium]
MRLILFIFFLSVSVNLQAVLYETIQFSYLSRQDGLSDNNVECIFKDAEGFLWFGTRNGLCRYDGYEIKTYRKGDNSTDLSGNRILSINQDKSGYLWVGTYKDGLNRFDKRAEEFTHFGLDKGIGERVNCVEILADSSIWIGSNKGVAVINKKDHSVNIYSYSDGLNAGLIYDILETKKGEIYLATENIDIQKLNKQTNRFENISYKRLPYLASNYRKHLIEGKDGILWIAASYHGLCSYNPENEVSEIYGAKNNNLSTNVLMGDMEIDPFGNIWICTEEDGINIFNPKTKTYTHLKRKKGQPGTLNSDHTYTVYFDNDNMAWIGTFNKGINIYNPFKAKFNASLFAPNDLHILNEMSILDVYEDSKNRVWIGTDGNGLFCFEKDKAYIQYTVDDKYDLLTSNIITSLNEDPLGNILIGMYSGGMVRFSPENKTSEKYLTGSNDHSVSSPHVWEIFKDSKDQIWLGMLSTGVDRFYYKEGKLKNFGPYSDEKNKIDFQNIMTILEDSDGDIWFGTEGRGIFLLDNETDRVLQIEKDSISSFSTEGVIKCLLQDKWGYIWIGTEDDGLYKFDKRKESFEKFNEKNGFSPDPVKSLMDDLEGNIWIGTTSGLFKYNSGAKSFNKFIVEDGLSSNDFNADAMLKLTDGRIIAGTNNGVDIISAHDIKLSQSIPRIVFTKLTVLGKEIEPKTMVNDRCLLNASIGYTKEFELNWKDKVFTIEFAALNYTLPQKCHYKYKLEGFDEDWVYTSSNRRMATYSNLDAGNYTFKVLASNNDGIWGDNELLINITVKPPFWETLVFRLASLLLVLLVFYLVYKRRIQIQKDIFRQKELENEKKIIALQNEKLESELKKLAFNILNKNKLLLEQRGRIVNLSNRAKVSVKEGLQKIVDKIDEDLDEEKDWKVIEPQIDNAYNHFISHLKEQHPDLSATEIRIASYIRMNLSTKEICELMNKTQRAVENDRYRLRKKIGLDANDSIKDHFLNL